MKAPFNGRSREITARLNYNYETEDRNHEAFVIQRVYNDHWMNFFCIKRNENCHHSRYPVQTSRSAIIYYLSFITRDCSFDKAEKQHATIK